MLTDADIANAHPLEPITAIARRAGLPADSISPYGDNKAKIEVTKIDWSRPDGKLVLVTGVSPTPAGEGKSTTLIGLTDALAALGENVLVSIREPSLGPVMGLKGGAAGGGYSQIVPMDDINLHFTGDFHAVSAANNTLAAMVDNHIQQGNELRIDPRQVTWQRCVDVNDRSLRRVVTGLGGPASGVPQETGFTITAASEIMAILGLATDLDDLTQRLGAITVGDSFDGRPITAAELGAAGALTALLKDAINPNLVQTLGGTPAFCHGGPFANIAHGCSTLLGTQVALKYGDLVLTEAGFGSDLGAEKFFDIKARYGGLDVAGAVVVTTIRSMKYHGGVPTDQLDAENVDALRKGIVNLERHVDNIRTFGVTPVVALNLFTSDAGAEREFLRQWADDAEVAMAEADVWAKGGDGAVELARLLLDNLSEGSHTLYDTADGVEAAITTITTEIYRAGKVELSWNAKNDLARIKENGWDTLPVCVSKTPYSFSDNPARLGAPEGHTLHVRKLIPRTGAGFIVALTGDVMTMPGLPKRPAAEGIEVDSAGRVTGLF